MQNLRVTSPADRTPDVLRTLDDTAGVATVSVMRGASVTPVGDVVDVLLARECTDGVIAALRRLGLTHEGAISLTSVETVLADAAREAERRAPGEPDDAIVWDELIARTREESSLNATFLAFLTIACLLSAIGVVLDSPVTIVGAVVVGPEFGPLAALAVGLVRRRGSMIRRSLLALTVGFPVAMVVTALGALAAEAVGWVRSESIDDLEQVDFIYQVGPFSLVVALLAGAAGMLALVSSKSAALVGVFISVTTVPAAGFAVVAATVGSWRIAMLSAGQLGINLVGIVVAASLVLLLHRRSRRLRVN
ncbi:DUF389 domain-containing protein [Rhodococcoides corynebacterioides]|uniref:DUF389 domain-containing protein n=1 Tax=Rhodococcoides corynebacterioides TaxID=53972 RepID=UPI001C9AAAC1|nr:DUF389 domain-containing protein [Rhodococcus corynebacterioides]MBY6350071.1 DUF389 domain-containing protein [Rhodococcus corynebacterioides]